MRRPKAHPLVIAAIAVLSPAAVSCGGSSETSADSTETAVLAPATGLTLVGPRVASDVIDGLSPVIIDVRTPAEFAEGHIEGARLIDISSPTFAADIEALDRAGVYFVYCRSGNRSSVATSQMMALGFDSVYELDGGVIAWSNEGLELVG